MVFLAKNRRQWDDIANCLPTDFRFTVRGNFGCIFAEINFTKAAVATLQNKMLLERSRIVFVGGKIMSQIKLSFFFIATLVASFTIFGMAQSAHAQKVTICIDFSPTGDITESDGRQSTLGPSGLSAAQQSTIITQVQTLYEGVFGKGNVLVKNAADPPCDGKFVLIDSGAGPGGEYGDAKIEDGVAVVHIGAYVKQGFKGDTLITAIGESAAHEAAHLYALGHSKDSNSIMVVGDSISVPRRMADHRTFTSNDSMRFNKLVAAGNVTPMSGSFAVSAPETGSSLVPDDKATDIRLTTRYTGADVGYISSSGNFVGGWQVSPSTNEYDYTFLGKRSINYALNLDGIIYSAARNATYSYADPIGTAPGSYAQGMLNFNVGGPSSTPVFIDLPTSGSSGSLAPELNFYYPDGPYGGNVIGRDHGHEFDVLLTPNYLDVEGYFGDYDTWYPPLGTEIVDGDFEDWGIDPYTGNAWATYWVLLDDGELYLLEFETCEECGSTEGTTLDHIPFNPFVGGSAVSLVNGPLTVFGGGAVSRYDSAQSKWVADSAGLNGAYVYNMTSAPGGRIFVGTSDGIYSQLNNTLSWSATGYPPRFTQAVFSDRSGRLYAYGDSTSRSSDNGATWVPGPSGIPGGYFVSKFGDDAFGNIYAIVNNYITPSQLYKSQFGVGPWVQIAQSVTSLSFDKTHGQNFNRISGDSDLFLSTVYGLYISTNQGNTWSEDNDRVRTSGYYSIAKNSMGKLLLGTDNGIFSGYYRDTAWQKLWPTTGNISQNRVPLYVDRAGTIYTFGTPLSGYNNIGYANARSTDGGQTWQQDSVSIGVVNGNGVYYADPSGKEYIATYGSSSSPLQIFSRSANSPWIGDQKGFVPNSAGNYPTAFGSDGSSDYMGITDSNIGLLWRYTAGTWALDTLGLHKDYIYSFGWDGKSLYAGGQSGIYRQAENGWTAFPFPNDVPGSANPFYVSVDDSGAVFSSFFAQGSNGNYTAQGVYFTKDLGQHWTRVNLATGIQINGLYSYQDSTYVLTTKGVFGFTSRQFALSHIPEGTHNGGTTSFHFGNVETGGTGIIPIRVTNFGNDTLRFSGLTISNPAFTIIALKTNTAPGQVTQAQLQFSPKMNGNASGTIVLASNSVMGPDTIIVDGESGANGSSISSAEPDPILSLENYPNPFASETTIEYSLANRERVTLKIFDVLGRDVATLVSGTEDAGPHTVNFDTGDLPDGVYIATLQVGSAVRTREMTVVR